MFDKNGTQTNVEVVYGWNDFLYGICFMRLERLQMTRFDLFV